MMGISATAMAIFLLFFCYVKFDSPSFSAGGAFCAIHLFSTIFGFYSMGAFLGGGSIELNIAPESVQDIYVRSCALVLAFAVAYSLIFALYALRPSATHKHSLDQTELRARAATLLPLFSAATLLLVVGGTGFGDLFYRTAYMGEASQIAKSIGNVGALASVFSLGYFLRDSKNPGLYAGLAIAFLLVFAGYSSRMFPMVFLLISVGNLLRAPTRKGFAALAVSIVAFPAFLHISLMMRSEPSQGLLPLFSLILDGEIWKHFEPLDLLNNIVGINFGITTLTALNATIDSSYLVTSLNPLPGFMTDWYFLQSGLNESTPYTMTGEWLNYGFSAGAVFFAVLGCIYAYVDISSARGYILDATAGFIVLTLSALTMLQYSTRASVRLIYYYFAFKILAFIARKLFGAHALVHEHSLVLRDDYCQPSRKRLQNAR